MSNAFPLLPLRDIVVFPGMVVPLFVGRDRSVAALEVAMEGSKDIFLLAQLDPGCDDPERSDLYEVGVVAHVVPAVEEVALVGRRVGQTDIDALAQAPQQARQGQTGGQPVGVAVDVGGQQEVVPLLEKGSRCF